NDTRRTRLRIAAAAPDERRATVADGFRSSAMEITAPPCRHGMGVGRSERRRVNTPQARLRVQGLGRRPIPRTRAKPTSARATTERAVVSTASALWTAQRFEDRARLGEVERFVTLGKPGVDLREHRLCVLGLALSLPEPGKARGAAELQG